MDAFERSVGLGLAWLLVAVAYVAGAIWSTGRSGWIGLALLVALGALAVLTLRADARSPSNGARRWRLGAMLGTFHVASCAVVGTTTGAAYSVFVAAPEWESRIAILAGGILLAIAALRPGDLRGKLEPILGLRAAPAGAAMGVVVLVADLFLLPSALPIAIPVGIAWALGYWLLDSAIAATVATSA